jgi:hypothetical protein
MSENARLFSPLHHLAKSMVTSLTRLFTDGVPSRCYVSVYYPSASVSSHGVTGGQFIRCSRLSIGRVEVAKVEWYKRLTFLNSAYTNQ